MRAVTVAALFLYAWQPAAPGPVDIRSRLAVYEKQVQQTGRQDATALADIGRAVIEQARRSPKFAVWTEACASAFVPQSDQCGPRLRAVLNRSGESAAMRAEAASALMALGDTTAADTLYAVLKDAPPSSLAPLAPIVALMRPGHAVSLLIRLSESGSATDQAAACRVLGAFDRPEVRAALAKVVSANPPGTEAWLLCMVARAQLGEPDAPRAALWGYGHSLQGEGQFYATKVMFDVGDRESAVKVLTELTRRGSIRSRLAAADLLIDSEPEAAIPIIEAAETDPAAEIRAAALSAERKLKRVPSGTVRALLADPDGEVQVRAAEVILDWAKREQFR